MYFNTMTYLFSSIDLCFFLLCNCWVKTPIETSVSMKISFILMSDNSAQTGNWIPQLPHALGFGVVMNLWELWPTDQHLVVVKNLLYWPRAHSLAWKQLNGSSLAWRHHRRTITMVWNMAWDRGQGNEARELALIGLRVLEVFIQVGRYCY